jgi:hypothetical protein
MGITSMGKLNQVKLHARYAAAHRRTLVQRALKLLDEADAKPYSSAEIARPTGLPLSPFRDEEKQRKQGPDWTSTNILRGQHLPRFRASPQTKQCNSLGLGTCPSGMEHDIES